MISDLQLPVDQVKLHPHPLQRSMYLSVFHQSQPLMFPYWYFLRPSYQMKILNLHMLQVRMLSMLLPQSTFLFF